MLKNDSTRTDTETTRTRARPGRTEAPTEAPLFSRARTLQRLAGNQATRRIVERERRSGAGREDPAALVATAERGVTGGGSPLPFLDRIQASFGRHDLAGARAHTGPGARASARAIDAAAYTVGGDVAFARAPTLHTAAHEAAHVIQQRAGIHLAGGVGAVGDIHERQADAVADAVVSGRSAEPLLDACARTGSTPKPCVQREYEIRPGDKVTVQKVLNMRNDWYDAAIRVLHARRPPAGDPRRVDFDRLVATFHVDKMDVPVGFDNRAAAVIEGDDLRRIFPPDLPKEIVGKVAHVLGDPLPDVSTAVREAYIRVINRKDWEVIERDLGPLPDQPGLQPVTSTITPVNQYFDPTYGAQGVPGKTYGTTGLSSMAPRLSQQNRDHILESRRPTNLWHSTLTDAHGQTLFAAFRSGAFSDSGIAVEEVNGITRQAAGESKARGVLEAMVIRRLTEMSPQARAPYLNGQQVLTGKVLAIDLLSDGIALSMGDPTMVAEHHAAIAAIHGRVFQYEILPPGAGAPVQVMARFEILDFNTGVNQASSSVFGLGVGGRQEVRNQLAFERLQIEVQHYRNGVAAELYRLDNAADANEEEVLLRRQDLVRKREQVAALMAKIERVGMGRVGDYKLPVLLANLGHLIGLFVHFNCKSGKDRTGLMDAKSKHLARELARRRAQGLPGLPHFGSIRSDESEDRHQQMLWESGNLQVLERNVGGQSLKVGDVAMVPGTIDAKLKHDLGGGERLRDLQGLKAYTNIDTIANAEEALDPGPGPGAFPALARAAYRTLGLQP